MKKITTVLILLFMSGLKTFAQFDVHDYEVSQVIPPSPNAASIIKGAEPNVSLYTGAASIKVPLHMISGRSLSHEVSLNYSATGIKVEEVAPWVGLGWSLKAGGAISRTTRGLPDDRGNGFMNTAPVPPKTTANYAYFDDVATGNIDGQPDIFSINAGGLSAQFILDKNGEPLFIPDQKLKLSYQIGGANRIISWIVTDTDGTRYYFDVIEKTTVVTIGSTSSITQDPAYTSSWYLSKIESIQATDEITFEYEDYYLDYTVNGSETIGNGKTSDRDTRMTINGKRLSKINYLNGSVEFEEKQVERCDLKGDYPLDKVIVKDGSGNTLTSYRMDYRYFDYNGIVDYLAPCGSTTHNTSKRLILDKVTESNGSLTKPPYQFTYETSVFLPDRFSDAQDHWGYYNGKGGQGLVPALKIKRNFMGYESFYNLTGADREVDPAYSIAGTLKAITYPTGGSTTFDLENNECESEALRNNVRSNSVSMGITQNNDVNINLVAINDPFVILNINGLIEFTDPNCHCTATIYQNGNSVKAIQIDEPVFEALNLDPGAYRVTFTLKNGCSSSYNGEGITVGWNDELPTTHKKVGGLRISRQIDNDGENPSENIITTYHYDDGGLSSGKLSHAPVYGYFLSDDNALPVLFRTSYSVTPNGHTQGSAVGYSKVTVSRSGTEDIGKTEYYYTTPADHPDEWNYVVSTENGIYKPEEDILGEHQFFNSTIGSATMYPYAPLGSKDYFRGLLKLKKDYKAIGNDSYQLVKKDSMIYGIYDYYDYGEGPLSANEVIGVVVGKSNTVASANLNVTEFTIRTGRSELKEQIVTLYDDQIAFETRTENIYDQNHFQLKQVITQHSNGQREKVTTKYVADYDVSQPYTANLNYSSIKELHERYNISEVIELNRYIDDGDGVLRLNGGIIKSYSYFDNAIIRPEKVYSANLNNTLTTYNSSSTANGQFVFDQSIYEEGVTFDAYDEYGNLCQQTNRGGVSTVYVWGYNGQYPVASIQNATYAAVKSVIGVPENLTAGLSENQKQNLSNSFPNALITTYEYEPGRGIKTVTDPNNRKTYYEYDDFGRLVEVRDHDDNILQQNEYNYGLNSGN